MRMTFEELDQHFSLFKSRRSPHERVWQEIVDVAMPFRGDITMKRSSGSTRIGPVFDNTCSLAAMKFANFLKGAIAPSQTNWMRLHAPVHIEENVKIRQLLDATSQRLLRADAASNFYTQIPLSLRDSAVIGQGPFMVEEKPPRERRGGVRFSGFNFTAVPPGRVWWSLGKDSNPDMVVCQHDLPALHAARWLDGFTPPVLAKIARDMPMEIVSLAHFVYENHDYEPGDAADSPWYTAWAVYDGHTSGQWARNGQSDINPYTVFGWMRVDGEEYFRGQGHIARPNARGVNMLMEMVLRAAPRDILAPLMVEEGANIEFDISENGVMVVRPPAKMAPQYLRSGADYSVAYEILEKDRQHIREAFFMDFLDNPDTQPRSREESVQRLTRGLQQMAAPAELVAQSLAKVVQDKITLMHAGHALPEFGEYLKFIGEEHTDVCEVVFTSPFFAAQKQGELDRIRDFLTEVRNDFKETGDPGWLDSVNQVAVNRKRALFGDVPAEILNTDEQVARVRGARARRAAQERALAVASAAFGGRGGGGGGSGALGGENVPQGSPAATRDLEVLP